MTGESDDRRFGERPLAQTVAAARAIRHLTGMLLSLEHPHPTVDAILAQFACWESELPEYRFDHLDAETASGTVNFPLVFEGPPGLVHGGFLAVFFDCVTQHHNCAAARTGRTRSLSVTFRRPTPALTDLRFDIVRREVDDAVTSTARILRDDQVLCVGELNVVAMATEQLTVTQYAGRREIS